MCEQLLVYPQRRSTLPATQLGCPYHTTLKIASTISLEYTASPLSRNN